MTSDDVTRRFAAHHAARFRYLARLTGDPDRAADAARAVFVRLIDRPPAFAADGAGDSARPWLRVMATTTGAVGPLLAGALGELARWLPLDAEAW